MDILYATVLNSCEIFAGIVCGRFWIEDGMPIRAFNLVIPRDTGAIIFAVCIEQGNGAARKNLCAPYHCGTCLARQPPAPFQNGWKECWTGNILVTCRRSAFGDSQHGDKLGMTVVWSQIRHDLSAWVKNVLEIASARTYT